MKRTVIWLDGAVSATQRGALAEPVYLRIEEGEQIAIVGPNASGKSRLAEMITGSNMTKGDCIHYDFFPSTKHYVSENVRYVTFKDTYGSSSDKSYYLQQRWNQSDIDPETPTAGEIIHRVVETSPDPVEAGARLQEFLTSFGLASLMDRYLITFSSGELRKFQLLRILVNCPRVLVIDNPYIGLDPAARKYLTDLFRHLADEGRLTLILVISRPDEIPSFMTHVVPVDNLTVGEKIPRQEYLDRTMPPEVIHFRNVTIRYGERVILDRLDWTVRKGEHWALTGPNGSGKSTLLSLVCADNPQAYACNIELFGRRRGSGESIWDIKKKIGYVSPEMHRAYKYDQAALDVVCSGLFDTAGLFHTVTEGQLALCRKWMGIFGISDLENRFFKQLSSGEQRMCLVCRAFVKEPPLLILDEPLHGLDDINRRKVVDIIDSYCSDPEKSLIMVTHYPEEFPACIDHSLTLVVR